MTHADELAALDRDARLKLLRFVISFAWADLSVSPGEITYVHRLVGRLRLEPDDARQVDGWLKVPPPPEEVDPTEIPAEHRRLFLEALREMVGSDGVRSPEEKESLRLLERLSR